MSPKLSDEDQAALDAMLKKREESRARYAAEGPPPARAPGGTFDKKWAEPFLGDDPEIGLPVPSAPTGVSAAQNADGVALYRDGRFQLSLALPGRPRFVEPGPDLDALAKLGDVAVEVRIAVVEAHAEPPLLEQVAALAGDICGADPVLLDGIEQTGVTAAASSSLQAGHDQRLVTVLGGAAIAIIMIDFDETRVDAATAATVRGAVVGTLMFSAEARRIPALLPASPWVEPGLPLRVRADRPALPSVDDPVALADELLALAGPLAPARPLPDAVQAAAEVRLARSMGVEAARAASASVVTAHDLRGLAHAIVAG